MQHDGEGATPAEKFGKPSAEHAEGASPRGGALSSAESARTPGPSCVMAALARACRARTSARQRETAGDGVSVAVDVACLDLPRRKTEPGRELDTEAVIGARRAQPRDDAGQNRSAGAADEVESAGRIDLTDGHHGRDRTGEGGVEDLHRLRVAELQRHA